VFDVAIEIEGFYMFKPFKNQMYSAMEKCLETLVMQEEGEVP
jgi:hypothetical protein